MKIKDGDKLLMDFRRAKFVVFLKESIDYIPDEFYFMEFVKANLN
jgi:hypothetical protein